MLLLITIISVIVAILIALVVLIKNNKNPINIWLFAFLISACLWVMSTNLLGTFWGGESVYPLRLPFIFTLTTGYSALKFAYYLCNKRMNRLTQWVEFILLIVSCALTLSPLVIKAGHFSAETDTILALERAEGYPFILGVIAYFLIKAVAIIFKERRHAIGNKKTQLIIVSVGITVGTVLGVITNALLPNVIGTIEPARFAFIALLILSLSLSYAILWHSFMDIRLAVTRTVGYLLSIVGVAVAFVAIVFGTAAIFFPGQFSLNGQLFYMGVAVVIALSFDPMHKFFDRLTKRFFYQDAYDTQVVLDDLADLLVRETSSVNIIMHDSLKIIHQALRSDYIVVVMAGENTAGERFTVGKPNIVMGYSWLGNAHFNNSLIVQDDILSDRSVILQGMKDRSTAIVAKLRTSRELIGYAFFGYKGSGSAYTEQDRDLIRLVADELAVALQNAMRFEEIEGFNVTLRKEVKEATSQLRASNNKLRRLDEAKDEFISMASHQLRTPLTGVKGYLSMALEGDAGQLNDQQRKLLEEAFMSAQRMVYLIGDFLNVSRIQTGKFVLELKSINLAVLVQEEVNQLFTTADRRHIKLEYHMPQNFPPLTLDEDKMRQVVMNFVDNAIYYSKPGGIVKIELISTATAVELRVRDTGIGVPESERHHLFTKFFRAKNAREVRPDGTGVGLFMAKKVITSHGGSIIFESQMGKGSVFGFSIPLKAANKPPTTTEEPSRSPLLKG